MCGAQHAGYLSALGFVAIATYGLSQHIGPCKYATCVPAQRSFSRRSIPLWPIAMAYVVIALYNYGPILYKYGPIQLWPYVVMALYSSPFSPADFDSVVCVCVCVHMHGSVPVQAHVAQIQDRAPEHTHASVQTYARTCSARAWECAGAHTRVCVQMCAWRRARFTEMAVPPEMAAFAG